MMKDEWMRAAMSDDSVVVELLVRLKQSQATATATTTATAPYPPMTWTVRMPRSRALRCDPSAAISLRNKHRSCGGGGDSSTRCSPNTPLSWSAGAASPSATAEGGFEEDSGISPSLHRSKATDHEFACTTTTTSRRSRRKKTFSELKEEESLLLKEKVHLKEELTKLRATFKEQTTENESLKRMKLELGLYSAIYASVDGPKMLTLSHQSKRTESKSTQSKESENRGGFFELPDLNSLPGEDDYCSESLYGMS